MLSSITEWSFYTLTIFLSVSFFTVYNKISYFYITTKPTNNKVYFLNFLSACPDIDTTHGLTYQTSGTTSTEEPITAGTTVSFSCAEGYYKNDASLESATCMDDGKYSSDVPYCVTGWIKAV